MMAVLDVARFIAHNTGVDLAAKLAESCRSVGANRTSVYEQRQRLVQCLEQLAAARPGRPLAQTPTPPDETAEHLRLTVEVLEFRLRHPGSLVEYPERTSYADPFRRFVQERRDRWTRSLESFAQAVRIPPDTLRDWSRQEQSQPLRAQEKKRLPLPVDASQTTRQIVEEWMRWVGPTRAFIPHAAQVFELAPNLITRLLKILGIISARARKPPRYRGSTQKLTPGTVLVTDGKWITVELLESQQKIYFNWQGIVDQTTGCDTAIVLSEQEDAEAVRKAYEASLETLGGIVPEVLLHDNRPCYDDSELRQKLQDAGTDMIHATPGRPQNKAILEGAFGLWEQRVGTLKLDDTDDDSLLRSAVLESLRAYTAATNSVPRTEGGGRSRLQLLQQACPTQDQRRRDEAFLKGLKKRTRRGRTRQPDPEARDLIEHVFQRFLLTEHDPKAKLRDYLATFQPAAIRRAAAILATKLERDLVQRKHAHRYLAKVIQTQQEEIDLERAAEELWELTQRQNQNWVEREERHFDALERDQGLEDLTRAVAERAAYGGIPLQSTFWTRKLLQLLRQQADRLVEHVKKWLIRLYDAPRQRRLVLLDLITAQQQELL